MIKLLKDKIFGNRQEREIKKFAPIVAEINHLYENLKSQSDDQLRVRVREIRKEIRSELAPKEQELNQAYEDYQTEINENKKIAIGNEIDRLEKNLKKLNQSILDKFLTEVFAIIKDTCRRLHGYEYEVRGNKTVWEMVPFDVQLIGGIVLHKGMIAEMATGEGKTLVAVLPLFLNSLLGHGVHLITVNDYLAQRDSEWMRPIFEFHGLEVGVITAGMDNEARKAAYAKDVTYGTNSEFGFDYLRDNMAVNAEQLVQRKHQYAIVDEVDSVLIDEARTPLIISGPSEASSDLYYKINAIIPRLKKGEMIEHRDGKIGQSSREFTGDYTVDEKAKSAALTEEGVAAVEKILNIDNLYDPRNIEVLHHVNQALKAHALFKNEVDYVVKDGEVMIVDEFTGRLMPGRRWSDGLHQAVEAKEGVKIESENQTLATITFQNYFRMYHKLAGMSVLWKISFGSKTTHSTKSSSKIPFLIALSAFSSDTKDPLPKTIPAFPLGAK